jgi:GAF domain-containing protein
MVDGVNKEDFLGAVTGLMTGHWLTDLANFSALVYHSFSDLNWAGFYLDTGDRLRLGPFAGKPACIEIPYNRGVCGKAFSEKSVVIVNDVDSFAGHIACDPASRSEIVVPFKVEEKFIGVFDVDAPVVSRFSHVDGMILETALNILASRNPQLKNFPALSAF